jgi:protein translocase SecG subunit
MLDTVLNIAQIIVSILLVIVILLQAPEGGLSPAFGGGGGEMYRSRRNVEKFLLVATIVLSIILALLSIALLH